MKRCALARALAPPVIGTVNHRVPGRLAVIRGHKILDPADHGGLTEAVARRAIGVVFDVEHAGKGDTIAGPAPAVRKEIGRLRTAAAFVGVGEVVSTTDKARIRSARVVR